MNVFHFLSAEHGLQSLVKRRLKISQWNDLNDPFELLSEELSTPEYRKAFRKFKEEVTEKFGVLCFSRAWANPVLWSHYADRHKGMCLGFEVAKRLLKPVTYTGTRLQLRLENKLKKGALDGRTRVQILSTKFEDWKYEDEVRIFLKLEGSDRETGFFFREYDSDIRLHQAILGPRCVYTVKEIRSVLGDLGPEVDVIKARLAFQSFRVVKNRVATRKQR